MSNEATGSTSKIVEWSEGTKYQQDRELSRVAANLAAYIARSTVRTQLSIANKSFVGVVRRAAII